MSDHDWAVWRENFSLVRSNNKDTEQSVYAHSLISAFVVRIFGNNIQNFEACLCTRVSWIPSQHAVSGHHRPAND